MRAIHLSSVAQRRKRKTHIAVKQTSTPPHAAPKYSNPFMVVELFFSKSLRAFENGGIFSMRERRREKKARQR